MLLVPGPALEPVPGSTGVTGSTGSDEGDTVAVSIVVETSESLGQTAVAVLELGC